MVQERSLTVRQEDVYEDLGLNKTAIQNGLGYDLLSDEILAKVSSTGQRIAFSHNILFDYAISVLLIDDKPQQLERFVLEDLVASNLSPTESDLLFHPPLVRR